MISLKRVFIGLVTAILAVLTLQLADAQSSPRLILQIYPSQTGSNGSQLVSVGPDGLPVKLRDLADGQIVAIDPGGKTLAVQSFDDTTRKTKIQIGTPSDSQMLSTIVETTEEIVYMQFLSTGGQFLTYTIVPAPDLAQPDKWSITLFDVTTNKKIELTFTFEDRKFDLQGGFPVTARALWFDKDLKRLYVIAYNAYNDTTDAELYMVDLSNISFEQAAKEPNLPSVKRLATGLSLVGGIQISPDGSKVAYLTYDSRNPVQNYNFNNPPSERIPITFNTITLYDLATQKMTVITLGKGQAIERMTWTSDGKQLLFTGGNFHNTYYVTTPRLYSVDIATGNVTDKGMLEKSSKNAISFLTACGQNIYVVKTQNAQDGLYVADLNNLGKVNGPLLSTFPGFIGCVASSG